LWSVPLDINDRGTIAGWANSGPYFAIVWRAGTHEPIDITPPGAGSATASGINDRGQVVGRAGSGPEWAFRWDPRTERAVDLGGLDGPSAVASKINESGIAAGWATTTDPPPPGQLATRAVIFLPRPRALPG
jgi:probable HAF family extracellular repeat protein